MSKRKAPDSDANVNADICEMLLELSNHEKNVTRNIHKSKVYRKAAGTLSKHPVRITSGDQAKKLEGIGLQIGKKIDELLATGKLVKLEKIRADDSSVAINQLTKVVGIGPAAARKFVEDGMTSVQDLRDNLDKLNKNQVIGVKHFEDFEKRIPREEMLQLQKLLFGVIEACDKQYRPEVCGSFRRGAPSSGDIDILLTHPDYTTKSKKSGNLLSDVVKALEKDGLVTDRLSLGDIKFMGVGRLPEEGSSYRRVDIRLIPYEQYPCALLYFTGSDQFNRNMRAKALDVGFTINEYCIRPMGSSGIPGEALPVTCERDIFDYVDMEFKEPFERNS